MAENDGCPQGSSISGASLEERALVVFTFRPPSGSHLRNEENMTLSIPFEESIKPRDDVTVREHML